MKIPIRNVYYLLAYAWGHADAARDREADAATVETLPDLLAFVLAHRTAALLRQGLDRSYLEEQVVFPGVRGKIDFAATIKQNLLSQARTSCIVEELRHDVLHNRILRSTLGRLLGVAGLDSDVRSEAALVYRRMEGISDIEVRRASFRRVRIHRNNRPYHFLMQLCLLLHEGLHLQEDGTEHFADLRDNRGLMARLFEEFVANFYKVEQSTYQVSGQPKMPWYEASSAVPEDAGLLPIMRPDVVLVSPRRRIILDTKFYLEPLMVSRYGGRRVRPSHLYQLFAYLENRNSWQPDGPRHEGLLLYPVVQDAFRLDFQLKGHRIQVRTIDLDQDWRRIRDDLLEIVA